MKISILLLEKQSKFLYAITGKLVIIALAFFVNISAHSQQGWFLQYGTPTSDFDRIFMVDSSNGWVIDYDSVFSTSNGGQNWIPNNVGYWGAEDIYFININTGWIVTGSYIIKTTNGGQNWFQQLKSPTQHRVRFVEQNTGFTIAGSQLCRRTTNGGTNWSTVSVGPGSIVLFSIYFANHDTGWIGGENGLLYKTTNCGLNWIQINTGVNTRLYSISYTSIDTGWAGGFDMFGESKIIFTSNGGVNWVTNYIDPISQGVEDIFFITPKEGWAVGLPGKVMHTTDAGTTWSLQSSNSGNIHLFSVFFITPKIGWIAGEAGGANGKILKTTTGGIVPITTNSNSTPMTFFLKQNYPNPFNPITKIEFDVPPAHKSNIKLVIYDLLGKEIAVLINQNLNSGTYEIEWNASNLTSGTYFYKLVSEDFTETKIMTLIK